MEMCHVLCCLTLSFPLMLCLVTVLLPPSLYRFFFQLESTVMLLPSYFPNSLGVFDICTGATWTIFIIIGPSSTTPPSLHPHRKSLLQAWAQAAVAAGKATSQCCASSLVGLSSPAYQMRHHTVTESDVRGGGRGASFYSLLLSYSFSEFSRAHAF